MSESRGPIVTLPAGRDPMLRMVPMPADANQSGDIFGGWIMAQVDIAGSIPAMRLAKGRVATVAVNSFQFKQPVLVGDVIRFLTRPVRWGHTSITMHIQVEVERGMEVLQVTEAEVVYVAVDAHDRKPMPLLSGAREIGQ